MKKSNEQKLRRQLEVLKAQAPSAPVSSQKQTKPTELSADTKVSQAKPKVTSAATLDYAEIKKDLIKTGVFSIITLAIIIALFKTEASWIDLIKFI